MRKPWLLLAAAVTSAIQFAPALAHAHGFVGTFFFPPTITTDDPLVADELALPTVSYFKNPGSPESQELDAGWEFDKVIIPKLALGISNQFTWVRPDGANAATGWSNLQLTIKYELYRNEPHQFILSAGLKTELGGTGSQSIGRDSFTTFIPTIYFGKGFGDLPDALSALQPFGVTGTIGQTLPTCAVTQSLEWGLAVEYNLMYLQQHVKDIGLPEPLKHMIPLTELTMSTPDNRGPLGMTTGTVNPGVLWESKYFQLGAEALIPINRESGEHVGAVVQMQIYIDDLMPQLFGHPLLGE